ncbi:hypothetical protein ACFL20_11120 [Spirochaetota bacterium]
MIIQDMNLENFQIKVGNAIRNDGWKLQGGVSVLRDEAILEYFQAMIKE